MYFLIYRHSSPDKQKQFGCPILNEGGAKACTRVQAGTGTLVSQSLTQSCLSVEAFRSSRRPLVTYRSQGSVLAEEGVLPAPVAGQQGSVVSWR